MFTKNNLPAIFLPRESRFMMLMMKQAHMVSHTGVNRTVVEFRSEGWWTVQDSKLAKSLRMKCVLCCYLDKIPMKQSMGKRNISNISPAVWKVVELDLMRLYVCNSDVKKEATVKVWGMVLEDVFSGA